jgi:hypothetical protein
VINIKAAEQFGSGTGIAVKQALSVSTPKSLGWLTASTLGRISGAPTALAVGQENALDWLAGSDEEKHKKFINIMKDAYPDQLSDVALRLGGTDTIDDLKRIWRSKRSTLPVKLFGMVATPYQNMMANIERSSHYNPISNAATVYGNVGEISAHELGHAADFNNAKSNNPSSFLNKIKRDAYFLSRIPEANFFGAGPMTHWTEIQANRNVNKAIDRLNDPEEIEKLKANAWRRLATGYGTYGAGTVLAVLAAMGKIGPRKSRAENYINSIAAAAAGALGGRAVAEIRNLISRPKVKPTKPDPDRLKEYDLVKK